MKGPRGAVASAASGFWLPMLESGAGGTDAAGQGGCRTREAEDGRSSLSLAWWFPLYGHQAPRSPSSGHAGRVHSHLESPGKSMGEAAAPGSPWGIPGCSLGWEVGSRAMGSEGQPFPWGSALHGSKQFSVADGAGDLGREKAPPVGRPERMSSHCRRRRNQRITARLLPQEPGL